MVTTDSALVLKPTQTTCLRLMRPRMPCGCTRILQNNKEPTTDPTNSARSAGPVSKVQDRNVHQVVQSLLPVGRGRFLMHWVLIAIDTKARLGQVEADAPPQQPRNGLIARLLFSSTMMPFFTSSGLISSHTAILSFGYNAHGDVLITSVVGLPLGHMLLTILELWIACDSSRTHICDLLRDCDPGVPREFLESFVLSLKSQIEGL